MVKTVDTDVVALAVATMENLKQHTEHDENLIIQVWVAFGTKDV